MSRSAAAAGIGDATAFRRILGHFPTGVAIVTATVDGRPHGVAVNSFTSVSLDPCLVSFCAAHSSTTWPQLRQANGFTVSILAADHERVGRLFATKNVDRFQDDQVWKRTRAGHPVLNDALAWLACTTAAVYPVGDHDVVIGEVTDGDARDGEPLLFFRGRYTGLRA